MIRAMIDAEGFPLRFFDTDVWEEELIPDEAIHIEPDMWQHALSNPGGVKYNGKAFVKCDPPKAVRTEASARQMRNRMLADCDWTQMVDAPLDETAREAWKVYRQALRDITSDRNWPDVEWPPQPSKAPSVNVPG